MDLFDAFVTAGFLAALAFQLWLTRRVFRSGVYEHRQKVLQAQLIWLLPVVGAGLVFSVMRDEERSARGAEAPRISDRA